MEPRKTRNAAQTAQSYFTKAANSRETAKRTGKKERSAVESKIMKLREQRLAKEAEDRLQAEKDEAANPKAPERAARQPRPARPARLRFTY